MKKSFRLLESNFLVLGKGIWIKLFAAYSGWFYVFSFTISNVFYIALIKHNSQRLPKYEFNLKILNRDIFATAKEYHAKTSEWYKQYTKDKKEVAQDAKNKLEKVDMLDTAKKYSDGRIYLD